MEYDAGKCNQDTNIKSKDGLPEDQMEKTYKHPLEKADSFACTLKHPKIREDQSPSRRDVSWEVNMEADITVDEIMQAGGIGARDDINTFVPIASDFTDIEERLHYVEDYESLEAEAPLKDIQPKVDAAKTQKEDEDPIIADSVGEIYGPFDDPSTQEIPKNTIKDIQNIEENVALSSEDASDAANMEASVTTDEIMRAGGFGAKDDVSSFLPVATDFTDFEANLRGARDYEDSDEKIDRPGLGWNSKAE